MLNRLMHGLAIFLVTGVLFGAGCAAPARNVPGTQVPDNSTNRGIIQTVEKYRVAVEAKDTATLVLLASPKYWEDSGTMSGRDDYGYDELLAVLSKRFRESDNIRYSLRYMNIRRKCPPQAEGLRGCLAFVTVLVDASYTVRDARGKQLRLDKRDQNQLVLEWSGKVRGWRFLTGM